MTAALSRTDHHVRHPAYPSTSSGQAWAYNLTYHPHIRYLIPTGVFATLELVALLEFLFPRHAYFHVVDYQLGIYSSVMVLGFVTTFGVLWLHRKTQPTDWAKYPAAGLLNASILTFSHGKNFEYYWPVTILPSGVMLLLTTLIKN